MQILNYYRVNLKAINFYFIFMFLIVKITNNLNINMVELIIGLIYNLIIDAITKYFLKRV
jgi:ABC-type enterochelin transport system permease subunit